MVFAGALVLCALPLPCLAQQVYAQQMQDGTYKVYDPTTQKTEYVRDVRTWAMKQQFERTGFGGGISPAQFQQGGGTIVGHTVKAAAKTVDAAANTAANTAMDAAAYVPGWRHYSNAARQLIHGGSRQGRR